jgi:hypothetical protein
MKESAREQYMAAAPEMSRDELKEAAGPRPVSREEADATLGPARHLLQEMDLIIRTLPDTDQQTAVLMNLIVMSIDRQMVAHPNAPRGKVINALCDEFRKRLQKYIPMKV